MAKGAPPKARALKVIEGDLGKRGVDKDKSATVKPDRDIKIITPSYLGSVGKAEFRRVAAMLRQRQQWSDLFRTPLGKYCKAFERWKKANEEIKAGGEVVKSPKGYPMQSPWLAIANKAFDQMLRVETEMGLTLLAQVRLQGAQLDMFHDIPQPGATKPTAEPPSDWDDLEE